MRRGAQVDKVSCRDFVDQDCWAQNAGTHCYKIANSQPMNDQRRRAQTWYQYDERQLKSLILKLDKMVVSRWRAERSAVYQPRRRASACTYPKRRKEARSNFMATTVRSVWSKHDRPVTVLTDNGQNMLVLSLFWLKVVKTWYWTHCFDWKWSKHDSEHTALMKNGQNIIMNTLFWPKIVKTWYWTHCFDEEWSEHDNEHTVLTKNGQNLIMNTLYWWRVVKNMIMHTLLWWKMVKPYFRMPNIVSNV